MVWAVWCGLCEDAPEMHILSVLRRAANTTISHNYQATLVIDAYQVACAFKPRFS